MRADQLVREISTRVLASVAMNWKKDTIEQMNNRVIKIISEHITPLVESSTAALEHVEELREAWRTGAIDERDGLGGLRSNRNVDVEVALRTALTGKRGTP